MSDVECKRLRDSGSTGPNCGCRDDVCVLGYPPVRLTGEVPDRPPSDETVDALEKQLLRDVVAWYSKPRQVLAAEDRVRSLAALARSAAAWMEPFDGSGIEWHEGLPSPYTYQASDFSKLVAAVHEYECRAQARLGVLAENEQLRTRAEAAEQRVAELEQALQWVGDHHPKAMREMPTSLFRPLCRANENPAKTIAAARSREQQDTTGGQA